MMTIEEKIKALPVEAKKEANDFIDFLLEKTQKEDKQWHMRVSEKSIDKIWDNAEDDVYNDLLER